MIKLPKWTELSKLKINAEVIRFIDLCVPINLSRMDWTCKEGVIYFRKREKWKEIVKNPPSTYQNLQGQSSCEPCATNSVSVAGSSDCQCEAGHCANCSGCDDGKLLHGSCEPCLKGYYKADQGNQVLLEAHLYEIHLRSLSLPLLIYLN